MVRVDAANEIIPRLWLGGIQSSQSPTFINANKINVIVNCTKDIPFQKLPGIYKYRVPVDDNLQLSEINSMTMWLHHILPLIHHHYLKGSTILIHCFAGMQRSAIVLFSYLYQYHTKNAVKTAYMIKSKRPIAFTPYMNFKKSFTDRYGETSTKGLSNNKYGLVIYGADDSGLIKNK